MYEDKDGVTHPRVVGVIPARYASTRLPGKALRTILGKPMIQRVYERCLQSEVLDQLFVATDDVRIGQFVESFAGWAILTSPDHASGTDRLAEAVRGMDADIVVNIQGDQPFIDPVMIGEAVRPLLDDPATEIATLMHPISRPHDLQDIGVVKVVVDRAGFAMYFSRSLIPFPRRPVPHSVYEHVGLYVYRKDALLKIARLEPTVLEQVESLEQLRWMEHGCRIRVVETHCRDHEFSGFSIDTQEDLDRAEAMLRERGLA
jgi:3-deoxy-manno-octulosonate cytidylyltransferase (CMP-KDO synthetase)